VFDALSDYWHAPKPLPPQSIVSGGKASQRSRGASITFSGIAFQQTLPCAVPRMRERPETATLSASTTPRSDDDDADRNQRRCGTDDDQCQKTHEGNEHTTILQHGPGR